MAATGNEPVKLSQLKAELSKGTVTRRIVTFTITASNTPYELPFAENWGIQSNVNGTYTAEFIDYGDILELSMLYSTSQINPTIHLCSKEDISTTANKFGRIYGSNKTTIIYINSYGATVSLNKINIHIYGGYGEFQSSALIMNGSTMYANTPINYIQLYFEK